MVTSPNNYVFLQEEDEYRKKSKKLSDDLCTELEQNGMTNKGKISFVGSFFSERTKSFVICYPKYLDKVNEVDGYNEEKQFSQEALNCLEHMKLVCKVIEKCSEKSAKELEGDFSPYDKQESDKYINLLSIAEFILQDYLEHGLYEMKTYRHKKNAKGPVSWEKTINKTIPFITEKNKVYYIDTINKKKYFDKNRLLTQIHALVVNECAKHKEVLLDSNEIKLPKVSELNLSSEEERKKTSNVIRSYMRQVFTDREINLLKALISWLDISPYYIKRFGTNNFQIIWEEVCKSVFVHDESFEDRMPTPFFYNLKNEKIYRATDYKLIPDIVRVINKDEQQRKFVLDAKYYKPEIPEEKGRTLQYAPAAGPIATQFSYMEQLKEKGEIMNGAFLFPHFYQPLSSDDFIDNIGFVIKPIEQRQRDKDVRNEIENNKINLEDKIFYFQINPNSIYKRFLNTGELKDEDMLSYFDFKNVDSVDYTNSDNFSKAN
ncbi:LlaJI family restriction endonuclease [Natranaerofaba carboxydovora]|uniref:LlaJI family restriction endonuclease n=1 Tax=Natranaerofaba carboxydovora TaxID=2742683 RepID=UPI001F14475B|nr:LlaJI family restriction endonuclease [Natranaerofaba carboxydovora]UMZ72999.1 Type-2 restriction enzyme BsuMI component YdjA [Natranaerofaba carboxydovora]